MKKSKILLLIFFAFSSYLTFGQKSNASKAETENWILEKLKSYSNGTMSKTKDYPVIIINYENYQFKIENGLLVIEYDYKSREVNSDPRMDKYGRHESKHKLVIQISEIKKVKCEVELVIETYDQSIKQYWNNELRKDKNNIVYIGFNCFAEENLATRLDKAFNHLKVFYPRNKKKEAF